ncbi:alanine/glycine:cation symporter family protein [Desulfovibrio cuneatus]|uniref:alanine/glycine:cation symporter family protein n=1 Tax=Desulfovibrio cuneatus TaxID=159728 RepID=UPI000409B3E3|nr:sodium:alanine symporter family protein [Desulfovibrio cuneatus]
MSQEMTFMQQLTAYTDTIGGFVWSSYLLQPLLLGTGAFLMIGLGFMPLRNIARAIRILFQKTEGKGEISPWQAMMTSMAATVGTGNIVGVATAILIGGPGAVFWMWCTALVGMATKFCEATLAVKYREVTPNGSYVGGPMYYIKNGLGPKWAWMAMTFAIFGAIACFGPGNMTQAHAIATNLESSFGISKVATSIVLFLLVGSVLIGGVKRIGAVAGKIVPFMGIMYILFGIWVLVLHHDRVPGAFMQIFQYAFQPVAAAGGAAGIALSKAIQMGIARGLFSNEAGLGTAPIAHATAQTDCPVRQGFLGMLDPFLDTIVICTVTAMIILIAGEVGNVEIHNASLLTAKSFETALPGTFGKFVVSGSLLFFAFTTILGWAVYGERCAMYIFGYKVSLPYRILFTCIVPVGALNELAFAWSFSDLFNGLMALPNLVALLLLSPVVFRLTKEYFAKLEKEEAATAAPATKAEQA